MSLKHFHVVFIVFSVLICLGFGLWTQMASAATSAMQVFGVFSIALGAGLAIYGFWFFRKSKRVIT